MGFRKRTNYQGGYQGNYQGRYKRTPYPTNKPDAFNKANYAGPSNFREVYWSATGPKTETKKLLGTTLELPIIAPMAAPPEDKKVIITQMHYAKTKGFWDRVYRLIFRVEIIVSLK
jgi:hypothetical protein